MKIIQIHNYYQHAGGEDSVVAAELALLRGHGHEVVAYYKSNSEIEASGSRCRAFVNLLVTGVKTVWNPVTYREFRKLLKNEQPDVVHCHNTFPLVSPAIYWACAKEKVPVVQTLHNYRLLCLNAFLFRIAKQKHGAESGGRGGICEKCLPKSFKWPGVCYGCYRNSRATSLVVAVMLLVHKLIGTWSKKVTAYIALTEFQKQKMIDGGLPADKIFVKPNFTQFDDESLKFEENRQPPLTSTSRPPTSQRYALFVGRLSFEKGCDVLIHAWTQFQQAWREAHAAPASAKESPQLLIVGDGPERESIEALTSILQQSATVHFAGRKPMSEVLELMRAAGFLVQPSVLYEGFPMTIVEAFSQGCPVIAAGQGGMAEALQDGGGLLFKPSDSESLSEKMTWSFMHPAELKQMGEKARRNFKAKYSAEVNYLELMEIYQAALKDLPC